MPFTASAQSLQLPKIETPTGERDVGAAISPMKKGQAAPFTGVLLSPKAVASVITELNSFNERLKIETDRVYGESKAQCNYEINAIKIKADADARIAQAKLDESLKRVEIFENAAKELQSSSSDPVLWGGLGFGLGIAATILITYASSHAAAQ